MGSYGVFFFFNLVHFYTVMPKMKKKNQDFIKIDRSCQLDMILNGRWKSCFRDKIWV